MAAANVGGAGLEAWSVETPSPIGIFRADLLRVSETFISAQAKHLERFRPLFLGVNRLGPVAFEACALSDLALGDARRRLFKLFRWPWLYGRDERLSRLALLHAHFGPDGVLALPLAEHLGIPLLVSFHGYDATIAHDARSAWRSPYSFIRNEEALRHRAGGFLAVSRFIAGKLRERGYPAERIVQHYIGVDTLAMQPLTELPRDRYVLCVGRHVEKKGIATLLRAFAQVARKHPDVDLIQIGGGPETARLQALAHELGLEGRVRWGGACDHGETMALMRGAEVFALTSETAANGDAEGLGLVFNEASAFGVPILGTRHGGIPEAVIDGQTGLLAPERDVAGIAERLDYMLSDRARARAMGEAGRRFVCTHFDLRRQTRELEAHYARLIMRTARAA